MTLQKQTILDYIAKYGHITDEEIQKLLELKRTRTYVLTKQMCEEGLIVVSGRGADKVYLMP